MCSTACFLHPTGNLTAQSHSQRCPSVFDTQWYWWVDLASSGSLVLRWRGWVGKLPEQEVQDWGYRTLNTGSSGLFKPWAWLWSFVRNWQCMTTESWSSGIIHSLYSSFFFWLSSVLRAPRRQIGHGFSSFFISGSIKQYSGGGKINGRNNQMLDNFGFQMLSLLPFPPWLIAGTSEPLSIMRVGVFSFELHIWLGKFALIYSHVLLDGWAGWLLSVIPLWFLLRLLKCAMLADW